MAATAASTSEPRLDGVAGRLQPEAAGARLSELFTRHASMVVGVCRGMLRHREEAEDAAQQTFLAAYKALLGGTKPREPAAWLATIARNECRRRITDRMRAGVPIGTVEETLADHATPISPADVSALREAIAGLPPMQQRAILLREFVGLSYDEVAQELAVTEPAVESLLFRARRTLQARLRPALGAAFGVGPIPALREALAQIVPGFTASSGGGIAALASLPAAAKLAAGVATIGLVAGGTVVAVEVERGPRHQPKPPAVLPLAGADVAAAGLVARPRALSLAAVSAPDSRRGRLGAGAARRGEQARGIRVQPLVTLTATSQGSRAPVDAPFSGASDTPAAPNESAGSAPPVSSSEPGASAPVAPASPATEQPTSSTPPKDEGQSGPSGGAADDDDHSGPGGGEPGEDEDHSGPGGGGDGEDHSGPGGGGGEGDDDVSGESGSSSGSSGSGTGEEPDQESSDSSGSGSSGSGSSGSGSDSGSSESSGSGSSGSGSGSGSGEDDGD